MSTRIEHLMKALRDLPYEDMVKVAGALGRGLGDARSENTFKIADALSGLRAELTDTAKEADIEEKSLREMVGTRRRGFTMRVNKLPKGWSAFIEEFGGSAAQSPEARVAIQHALDQAVTAHIMMK